MDITTPVAQGYMEKAKEKGCVEVSGGIYLHSRENILSDQIEWDDEDESKDFDFSTNDYWLTAADSSPQGIDTADQLVSILQ